MFLILCKTRQDKTMFYLYLSSHIYIVKLEVMDVNQVFWRYSMRFLLILFEKKFLFVLTPGDDLTAQEPLPWGICLLRQKE